MTTQTDEAVTGTRTLHERWEDGDLTDEQFVALASAVVLRAKVRATVRADVALARELTTLAGYQVAPLGLTVPAGEPKRLREAFATLTEDEGSRARVERVADNEPKEAAANARSAGIARSSLTSGWTRSLNGAKSCPACTSLADGSVLSPNTHFWRHVGCDCTATPVADPGRSVDPVLSEKSSDWLRHQLAITEGLKASPWRTKQLARLRDALGNL